MDAAFSADVGACPKAYYGLYGGVRNATWRVLLHFDIAKLPVSCEALASRMKVPVLGYARADPLLRELGLRRHCEDNDGFAIHIEGRWCIFVNDDIDSEANRNFILAHELGHIFLGHVMEENLDAQCDRLQYTRSNRGEWAAGLDRVDAMERDANMFAARMLSPACALWGLDLHTPEDIGRICALPYEIAKKRAERMRILYERNLFLKSGVEGALFERFTPYLRARRPDGRLPDHCRQKLSELKRAGRTSG